MTAPKKLFIKTYGCQMNVYDSERMAEALGGQGYVSTEVAEEADMILVVHLLHETDPPREFVVVLEQTRQRLALDFERLLAGLVGTREPEERGQTGRESRRGMAQLRRARNRSQRRHLVRRVSPRV